MKRILCVLLAMSLLASALLFASCGGDQGGNEEKNDKMVLGAIDDLSEFTIVRQENGIEAEKQAAVDLRKLLSEKFGVELKITTDYSAEKEKEILIGHTSRSETKSNEKLVTSYSEYVIKRMGDKIVILAGSEETLAKAIDFWTTSMVNKAGALCIPNNEEGYFYSPDGKKFQNLTVEGTSIKDFVVVNEKGVFKPSAQAIVNTVFDNADIKLAIKDFAEKDVHFIKICSPVEDGKKSSIEVKDGNIYITPSYYDTDWAADYLSTVLGAAPEGDFDITSYINSEAKYDIQTIYDKDDVMKVLEQVYNSDQIIVGTEIGNDANAVSRTLENYYEKSGEYPGILGLDVRLSNLHKLGDEGRAQVIADLTGYAEGGGIVTASAHFSNPAKNGGDPTVESYRGRLGGDEEWAKLVTEGTDYNISFKKELEGIADFFEALKENGVPVIWRPLHETNGDWFWFCMVQGNTIVSEDSFKNLWIYIHDYFTIERGLDNLLWEFGPNIGNESQNMTAPLYGFPGKEYVDLVGFDWYTGDGNAYKIETTPTYKDLYSLGMVININEFGPSGDLVADEEGEKQEDLFSCRSILAMLEEIERLGGNYKFGYFLTWTSHISIPELGYADEFMAHEITLGQADVKAMFEALG